MKSLVLMLGTWPIPSQWGCIKGQGCLIDGHKQAKAYGEVWRGLSLWSQCCSHQIYSSQGFTDHQAYQPPYLYPRPADSGTGRGGGTQLSWKVLWSSTA